MQPPLSSPIQYALLNGEDESGVSIIHLNRKIDSGNILGQKKIKIDKDTNFGDMYEKLSYLGSQLLIEVIDGIKNNKITSVLQNDSQKTLAPKIKKEQYKINWSMNAIEIHNQIRAFDPYPGAYSFINGKRIKLFSSLRIEDNKNYIDAKPGQLIIDKNLLFIKANKGIVCVSKIQLEGKNKMFATQFIKTLNNKIYILE